MKKLTLFLTISLTSFWLFGRLGNPKPYSEIQPPKFLSSFIFESPMTQWKGISAVDSSDQFHFGFKSQRPLEWARTYYLEDDDVARFVMQTDDGGYVVGGMTTSLLRASMGIFLFKISPSGGIEWQHVYYNSGKGSLGVGFDRPLGFHHTNDGGYVVVGNHSHPTLHAEVLVLKLSPMGEIEWQFSYGERGGEIGHSIQQTSDGGYIVAGLAGSWGDGWLKNIWVLKLSSYGMIEWERTYGVARGWEADWLSSRQQPTIRQTSDGGYILAAMTDSFGAGEGDFWLLKLTENGDIEWQRAYGGENIDNFGEGTCIHEINNKGYIVAGTTNSFGAGRFDIWVLRLTESGDIEWQRTYGGELDDWTHSMRLTEDGGCIITGLSNSFSQANKDFILLKLSSMGDIEWQKTYGRESPDEAFDIQLTNDGGYIAAGRSRSPTRNIDEVFVIKVSSDGNLGQYCGVVKDSNVTVSDTYVLPSDTDVKPKTTQGITSSLELVREPSHFMSEILCWNLNKPPINISLTREINRGLFKGEAFNTLSWDPNPVNDQFMIVEYRVYRRSTLKDEDYRKIGTMSAGTHEYIDGYLGLEEKFEYVVTSVDADGNESPKSESVRNE